MEKKQTAVQWLIENAKGFHNAESSKAMQEQALLMEREQMLRFAHYLRNGLTNMEYCKKEHEEHLEYWCQNYR